MKPLLAALLLLCASSSHAQQQEFALHNGDRIVFYGDSITAQRLYTVYAETAVHALHPEWELRFYNAGVGGDKVTGGIAGTIDQRFDRDVFSRKPTVITIMLGMNDRGGAGTPLETYLRGYRHILERIRKEAPQARILLIGPSPLDSTTRLFDGSNQTLVQYSEAVKGLAAEFKTDYVDFNHPVVDALQTAYHADPDGSELLIPDRVHPAESIHMVMAQTLLRAWHFPEAIADVAIEAKDGHLLHASGSAVEAVHLSDGALEWTESDGPDAVPFQPEDGPLLWWNKIAPQSHLGIRQLQIQSLPTGKRYALEIDGKAFRGTFTAQELQQTIDLSITDTPMHAAGRSLYYACADSEINQVVRNRILGSTDIAAEPASSKDAGTSFLEAAIERSEHKIDTVAVRTTHRYRLHPVDQAP